VRADHRVCRGGKGAKDGGTMSVWISVEINTGMSDLPFRLICPSPSGRWIRFFWPPDSASGEGLVLSAPPAGRFPRCAGPSGEGFRVASSPAGKVFMATQPWRGRFSRPAALAGKVFAAGGPGGEGFRGRRPGRGRFSRPAAAAGKVVRWGKVFSPECQTAQPGHFDFNTRLVWITSVRL